MNKYRVNIRKFQSGFTVIEILISVFIIGLLAALSVAPFVSLNKSQALDKAALLAISVLDEARSLTLASKNSSRYGAHFEDSQIVLFTGSTYSAVATDNQINPINSIILISAISLAGGGSEVIFDRLTGATSQYGSVTFSLKSDASNSKTVNIYATGAAQSD